MGMEKYENGFKLTLHPDALSIPYFWSTPQKIFVNSMSDLFHEDIPLDFVQDVFRVMNDCDHHIFQILTKRAARLEKLNKNLTWTPNIWMGVSVEDERVKWRIDHLRRTNAKVKFLSCEPLIGAMGKMNLKKIDWVIVGGESGPKARLIKKEWIEEIKSQCDNGKAKFFFKQWGRPQFNDNDSDPTIDKNHPQHAKGGCQLNGNVYHNFPAILQPVRFPFRSIPRAV